MKLYILVLVMILLMPAVLANPNLYRDCVVHEKPSLGSTQCPSALKFTGSVTYDGHFSSSAAIGTHNLCCPTSWSGGHGQTTFRYSLDGGDGHVQDPVINTYNESVYLGAGGTCSIVHRSEPKPNDVVCIFSMSGPDNAHIGDCSNMTIPSNHSFQYQLRCGVWEICDDGIDNTGDGLIDCAAPRCHPSAINNFVPQVCDPATNATNNNNQTTADCLADPARCHNPNTNLNYYCSYGIDDNPVGTPEPVGRCCPAGQYAVFNADTSQWECQGFQECGIASFHWCKVDFDDPAQRQDWFSSVYEPGLEFDWCHSQVPHLYSANQLNPDFQSAACCPIAKFGKAEFYIDSNNVKIFG